MADRLKLRRDTAANWTSVNPVLESGEPGYELDTGRQKIGNGSSDWNTLPYLSTGISFVRLSGSVIPPVSSTNYYLGHLFGTSDLVTRMYNPINCKIKAIMCSFIYYGSPTSQSMTVYLMKNGNTETLITNSLALTFGGGTIYTINTTGLNVALSTTDFYNFRLTTPAWGTAPTQLYFTVTSYFEN